MALTDSSRVFTTEVQDFVGIMNDCQAHFEQRGYNVTTERTYDGGFISLTKGGIFRTISGMKTGLNITLSRTPGSITVSMKIGLFGKQAIPAAIAMLVFWPVLIPQIFGLVQQSKLDTEAYDVIETAIRNRERYAPRISEDTAFCVYCGASMPHNASVCPSCGKSEKGGAFHCTSCGAEISPEAAFCYQCGTRRSDMK